MTGKKKIINFLGILLKALKCSSGECDLEAEDTAGGGGAVL